MPNKPLPKTIEAHDTEEDYCCACGYDLAVFEGKLKAQRKEFEELLEKNRLYPISDEYQDEFGTTSPENMRLIVKFNSLLDKLIEQLK